MSKGQPGELLGIMRLKCRWLSQYSAR